MEVLWSARVDKIEEPKQKGSDHRGILGGPVQEVIFQWSFGHALAALYGVYSVVVLLVCACVLCVCVFW